MSIKSIVLWLILTILLIIFLTRLGNSVKDDYTTPCDQGDKKTFFRLNKSCDNKMSIDLHPCFEQVFKELGLKEAKRPRCSNILMLENITFMEDAVDTVVSNNMLLASQFLYGMKGSDMLAGKNNLMIMVRRHMSQDDIDRFFPRTYIMSFKPDLEKLKQEYNKNTMYILKSNKQRQQGYQITNNLEYIEQNKKDFVVCQELLQDPLLVNGRKINIRVYMLILLKKDQISFYIYQNGFMYYTPKPFKAGSSRSDENITTGYIDRAVYENNPLTISDLSKHLGAESFDTLWKNTKECFSKITRCYRDFLLKENTGVPGVKFMIYGCDIAPDSKLDVKCMEVNKGPDLKYKDERDKEVKFNMVKQMMQMVLYGKTDDPVLFESV